MSEEYLRQMVAYHEAGHVVASMVITTFEIGTSVGSFDRADITPAENRLGIAGSWGRVDRKNKDSVLARVVGLLSGAFSVRRWLEIQRGKPVDIAEALDYGARNDVAQVESITEHMDDTDREHMIVNASKTASDGIEKYWDCVCVIAAELLEHEEVTSQRALEIMTPIIEKMIDKEDG